MKYMPKVLQNNCKKYICNFLKVFKYFSEILCGFFVSSPPPPSVRNSLSLSVSLSLTPAEWGGGAAFLGLKCLK